VYPHARRGASRLSPYIRHGLISLPRAWSSVGGGPAADVSKFRDELLWQEYARHMYARTVEQHPASATPSVSEARSRTPAGLMTWRASTSWWVNWSRTAGW
jgi:deoxyribodipyrimidine photo-lyase